ncbi:MAG: NTP transferase domain-containing protein [bacterium]|nr:NTP transferase domain-containing protein [bacterium]
MKKTTGNREYYQTGFDAKRVLSPSGVITKPVRETDITAVILAAGEGNRIRGVNGGVPKPLTSLFGLSLIERAILSCRGTGVSEFFVVTGAYEDKVRAHVTDLGLRLGVTVKTVHNKNWRRGNGTSVLTVSPYIKGRFLLLMADHLFDPEILLRLFAASEKNDCCLLAVDRRIDRQPDLRESTKVRLEGEAITAIGKDLGKFDAIDTGIFMCSPYLFDAIEEANLQGDGSLSGGVRRLVAGGNILAVDIYDRFWVDIDTRENLSMAKSLLLADILKPADDGFVARYINRRLSIRISGILARTRISPNTISVASFILCLAGALLFGFGKYTWTILAGFLVQIASVLDGCDGEIARLKFRSSPFGGWLDTILDRYGDVAIAVGITFGYWLTHPHPAVWLIGITAMFGFVLGSYMAKEYALRHSRSLPEGLLGKLARRDFRLFAFFVGALINRPFETLILIGFISHLSVVWSFVTVLVRKSKKSLRR